MIITDSKSAREFFIAPDGQDTHSGSRDKPFASLHKALQTVRKAHQESPQPIVVYLREGTHYLSEALTFTPEDSGNEEVPITYRAYPSENAVISGGFKLELEWIPYRDGIMKAEVPKGTKTDQLFVNHERLHMARYPNFDPNERIFNGYAAECFDSARARRWADPNRGFIHAMHKRMWGDFHYLITGKDEQGNVQYEGGWQNNRRMGMHDRYRFVENIFEELDAPGEWFLDEQQNMLYVYPPEGVDLSKARIEGVYLQNLIAFLGSEARPVKNIVLRGLTFRHCARTFMETSEPLLRSDWTIYRGGSVLFDGAENCLLEDCYFDQVGGNAIFINKYNRRITIRGSHIAGAGANGVAFVGDTAAVRNPLFEYGERQEYTNIDRTPGPITNNYPSDCLVEDCLIYRTGRFEKQSAPIQISMSQHITIRHCSIYDVPRAGINISEGTWGGHIIEFCDVFDTVMETGDHGSFNSWGRDRYWGLTDIDLNQMNGNRGASSELPVLDAVKPNILRNNRWRCDHGWDIDLDDGSSNYYIYNNLCLNGGIKLREGFYRICENNIMINNTFHPHVWYKGSQDIFRKNIVFDVYRPIRVPEPWGQECDDNLLHTPGQGEAIAAEMLQHTSKQDSHSVNADAMFLDPPSGDYRVSEQSPAFTLGFNNFPMNQFGVQKKELRAIARIPQLPSEENRTEISGLLRDGRVQEWLGTKIKNVVGLGEISVAGLPGETGVLVVSVPAESQLFGRGLVEMDVIIQCNGNKVHSVQDLLKYSETAAITQKISMIIIRNQQEQSVEGITLTKFRRRNF